MRANASKIWMILVATDIYSLYVEKEDGRRLFLGIFSADDKLQELVNGPKE